MTEVKKSDKRRPDFANDFLAVWMKADKNSEPYLAIKVHGEYYNVFPVKEKKK